MNEQMSIQFEEIKQKELDIENQQLMLNEQEHQFKIQKVQFQSEVEKIMRVLRKRQKELDLQEQKLQQNADDLEFTSAKLAEGIEQYQEEIHSKSYSNKGTPKAIISLLSEFDTYKKLKNSAID